MNEYKARHADDLDPWHPLMHLALAGFEEDPIRGGFSARVFARGDFDIVVAMYHDQGHGPVKVLGIEAGVNITVGLPVIRTSVDHGTAFDIAGTGRADERSMLVAIEQAIELAQR
jgi:4-hydroxy-L-threonine phosphate dehydrogenase PdxA